MSDLAREGYDTELARHDGDIRDSATLPVLDPLARLSLPHRLEAQPHR